MGMVSREEQQAMQVSAISMGINLALSACKLIAGLFAHSGAMLSDAVHSASDVCSTIVVMIGIHFAGKQADKEHPYGHERLESIAAILLAMVLAITGVWIGWCGIQKAWHAESLVIPGAAAIWAALLSIGIKEWMYRYTRAAAKRIHSDALMADAWHHRTDAMSSIGALIGILGARLGYPILDPLASVCICLFIVKAALQIFLDASDRLVDKACDYTMLAELTHTILAQPGVLGLDLLRTRLFGARVYVELEIRANSQLSLEQAHEIAQQVHDVVEQRFPAVKHCMVHVNPMSLAHKMPSNREQLVSYKTR